MTIQSTHRATTSVVTPKISTINAFGTTTIPALTFYIQAVRSSILITIISLFIAPAASSVEGALLPEFLSCVYPEFLLERCHAMGLGMSFSGFHEIFPLQSVDFVYFLSDGWSDFW
jgi:hypothetical protein